MLSSSPARQIMLPFKGIAIQRALKRLDRKELPGTLVVKNPNVVG